MIVHDVVQGSEDWFACRIGRMTGSHAQEISANGKGLNTYIYKILAEKSSAERESYTNEHMQRGNELEPVARGIYELAMNTQVKEVGFIEHDEYSGCSPDGLIDEDGGIEIKCPSDPVYSRVLINRRPDSKYAWQCQMAMMITGRKWWDLVYFNPNFEQSMTTFRLEADEEKHEKLRAGLERGKELIKEITSKL